MVLIIIRWGDCSYLSGRFCLSYLLSITRMLSEFRVNKFTLSSLFWSEALRGETVLVRGASHAHFGSNDIYVQFRG